MIENDYQTNLLIGCIIGLIFLLLISAWLYSYAPYIFRKDNLTQLSHLKKINILIKLYSYTKAEPKIYYPWKEAAGYMKLVKVNVSEWLEIDSDTNLEIHLIKNDKLSDMTFLIHSNYKHEMYQIGLEVLLLVIEQINGINKNCIHLTFDDYRNLTEVVIDEDTTYKICEFKLWPTNISKVQESFQGKYHPLQIARLLIGEDLNILIRNKENLKEHILIGAALCFPDRWHLESKLGLPLAAIHYPINTLNTSKESLSNYSIPSNSPIIRAMERFFDSLYNQNENEMVTARYGWFFQSHPNMTNRYTDHYSTTREILVDFMEKIIGSKYELHLRRFLRFQFTKLANNLRNFLGFVPLELYLRTERQSFRYLKDTNSILFTIRTRITPINKVIHNQIEGEILLKNLKLVDLNDNSSKGEFCYEVMSWLYDKFKIK